MPRIGGLEDDRWAPDKEAPEITLEEIEEYWRDMEPCRADMMASAFLSFAVDGKTADDAVVKERFLRFLFWMCDEEIIEKKQAKSRLET